MGSSPARGANFKGEVMIEEGKQVVAYCDLRKSRYCDSPLTFVVTSNSTIEDVLKQNNWVLRDGKTSCYRCRSLEYHEKNLKITEKPFSDWHKHILFLPKIIEGKLMWPFQTVLRMGRFYWGTTASDPEGTCVYEVRKVVWSYKLP